MKTNLKITQNVHHLHDMTQCLLVQSMKNDILDY